MTAQASLPPLPTSYIDAIRTSCRDLREAQNIQVTDDSVQRLLFSPSFLGTFKRVSTNHGVHFPLKFPSVLSELNFLSILCLLNFASGYRVPLHEQTGRGAWDNIRALAFGMYLSSATGQGDLLSAKGMKTITPARVAELMSVKIHVERPHETLRGVTVGEVGGYLYDLAKLISGTLIDTGNILEQSGVPDLGTFVMRSLSPKRPGGGNATVDDILKDLVSAFPAFRDMAVVDGRPVYCFKKALFLIHAVTLRFKASSPPPFPLPDTTHSPVFTDNVIPSLLVHLGVLDLSGATNVALRGIFPDAANDTKINALLAVPKDTPEMSPVPVAATGTKPKNETPREGPVLTSEQAYILRAAAVDACEKIVNHAHSLDAAALPDDQKWIREITLPQLDVWLWAVAKDRSDYRDLERFVLRDTVFF